MEFAYFMRIVKEKMYKQIMNVLSLFFVDMVNHLISNLLNLCIAQRLDIVY